jgi:hypothetical protein
MIQEVSDKGIDGDESVNMEKALRKILRRSLNRLLRSLKRSIWRKTLEILLSFDIVVRIGNKFGNS